jgi:hypothetical protein
MLPVAKHNISHIAHAKPVHQNIAYRHPSGNLRLFLRKLQTAVQPEGQFIVCRGDDFLYYLVKLVNVKLCGHTRPTGKNGLQFLQLFHS